LSAKQTPDWHGGECCAQTRETTMARFIRPTRRDLVRASALAACGLGLVAPRHMAFAQTGLTPTPACHDGDEPTLRQTEGPYFKPKSPERSDLREPGMTGTRIALSGLVLTRACRPVAGALVDLWHADETGEYDNKGFRLRGHVFTDADGRYGFATIVPGLYRPRARHFHVKVQAPGRPVLTTQFYFPDEPDNRRDGLFRPELTLRLAEAGDGRAARFDVVLDMG
jgi:protocatechuate 3,4-dioxygenase beta subunit